MQLSCECFLCADSVRVRYAQPIFDGRVISGLLEPLKRLVEQAPMGFEQSTS